MKGLKYILIAIAFMISVNFAPSFAFGQNSYLLEKAMKYERNIRQRHVPGYGGIVHSVYETGNLENLFIYMAQGDSTMWTSTYLAAESFRYAVTGSKEAMENAIAAIQTLHDHKEVTGTVGYIGRYVGPIETPFIFDYLGSHFRYSYCWLVRSASKSGLRCRVRCRAWASRQACILA